MTFPASTPYRTPRVIQTQQSGSTSLTREPSLLRMLESQNASLSSDPKAISLRSGRVHASAATIEKLAASTGITVKRRRSLIRGHPPPEFFLLPLPSLAESASPEDLAFWDSVAENPVSRSPRDIGRRVRNRGPPPQLRMRVWRALCDASEVERDCAGLYAHASNEASAYDKIVAGDVSRTFPHVPEFKPASASSGATSGAVSAKSPTLPIPAAARRNRDPTPSSPSTQNNDPLDNTLAATPAPVIPEPVSLLPALSSVLHAYSLYDHEVGYCQGMSFVAGFLLWQGASEMEAFSCLVRFMEGWPPIASSLSLRAGRGSTTPLRTLYTPGMPGLHLFLDLVDYFAAILAPKMRDHLDNVGIAPASYAAQWALTLFASSFPRGFVERVWDLLVLGTDDPDRPTKYHPLPVLVRISCAVMQQAAAFVVVTQDTERILDAMRGGNVCRDEASCLSVLQLAESYRDRCGEKEVGQVVESWKAGKTQPRSQKAAEASEKTPRRVSASQQSSGGRGQMGKGNESSVVPSSAASTTPTRKVSAVTQAMWAVAGAVGSVAGGSATGTASTPQHAAATTGSVNGASSVTSGNPSAAHLMLEHAVSAHKAEIEQLKREKEDLETLVKLQRGEIEGLRRERDAMASIVESMGRNDRDRDAARRERIEGRRRRTGDITSGLGIGTS
ncbi:hypothetical protein HDU93_000857 [Gonapodya sp. JEL0774]|nr:hypothetical protein HDU93_000857 [Gonapodya sp. JEL0774]